MKRGVYGVTDTGVLFSQASIAREDTYRLIVCTDLRKARDTGIMRYITVHYDLTNFNHSDCLAFSSTT